ncbi:MAG: hypothetical protein LC128_09390 [Chitinophagales bacterium]|nr:hypothetical protein [Chitinophagales bacterium]
MSEQGLAIRDGNLFIAPVVNVQGALQRYQDMKDFIEGILRKDVDYGVIPGTGKPTLLKPGAEKLTTFFGLSAEFQIIEKDEDWTGKDHDGEPFFNYWYKCRITRNGKIVAEGEGSCNSFEKKYRYRSANIKCPSCGAETVIEGKAEFGGGWLCWKKKGGCGAKFKTGDKSIEDQPRGQVKNPDVADIVNTLQKMAQKRAYIAAVLLATNASEYFTQDIEDYIDADFVAVDPEPAKPKAQPQPPAPSNNGQDLVDVAIAEGGEVVEDEAVEYYNRSTMSLETAEGVTSSDGTRYGDLPTDKLAYMANAIQKAMKKNGMSHEKHEEHQMKLDAIRVILASRDG